VKDEEPEADYDEEEDLDEDMEEDEESEDDGLEILMNAPQRSVDFRYAQASPSKLCSGYELIIEIASRSQMAKSAGPAMNIAVSGMGMNAATLAVPPASVATPVPAASGMIWLKLHTR
jgi:hypothetical protein